MVFTIDPFQVRSKPQDLALGLSLFGGSRVIYVVEISIQVEGVIDQVLRLEERSAKDVVALVHLYCVVVLYVGSSTPSEIARTTDVLCSKIVLYSIANSCTNFWEIVRVVYRENFL